MDKDDLLEEVDNEIDSLEDSGSEYVFSDAELEVVPKKSLLQTLWGLRKAIDVTDEEDDDVDND